MCPSFVVYAVDHIVAPRPSNNTRKICIWICAWNNYVSYTLVCVHFIVCSMYVSSCSTPSFSSPSFSCPSLSSPSFSSPANSAISPWNYEIISAYWWNSDLNCTCCMRLCPAVGTRTISRLIMVAPNAADSIAVCWEVIIDPTYTSDEGRD